jgi:hypothetical protein
MFATSRSRHKNEPPGAWAGDVRSDLEMDRVGGTVSKRRLIIL